MFDRLRKAVGDIREGIANPIDLMAVPDVHGASFGDLDPTVVSAYLHEQVTSIEPMGALGPQATSMVGRRIQQGLREASAGHALRPGEIVPGQRDAMEARLRADGVPEAMIAQIASRIDSEAGARVTDGWDVVFADGDRASVRIVAAGSEDAQEYDRLERRWDRENGTDGHRAESTPALRATVQRYTQSPYESYCLTGELAAKGASHVALAQSDRVGSQQLCGLAALALRTVEGV
jgi:hypothetical protein